MPMASTTEPLSQHGLLKSVLSARRSSCERLTGVFSQSWYVHILSIEEKECTLTLCLKIVMYLNNYIDRNALPYARIQGMEEDLGLTGIVSSTK